MQLTEKNRWLWHHARNSFLIALSLAFLPFSATLVTLAHCLSYFHIASPQIKPALRNDRPVRVLVTGVGMTKGLFLVRSFYLGGCHVVGVDFRNGINISCGQFSKALSSFYPLYSSAKLLPQYEAEILAIVQQEQIDLCVTCSGVATAAEEAKIMESVERSTGCRVIQLNEATIRTLDDKLKFMRLTDELGLPNPRWHSLESADDIPALLHKLRSETNDQSGLRYIIKCAGMDDASRGEIPILDPTRSDECEAILKTLNPRKDKPWILQEYFPSEDEYCTHALVIRGQIRAFTACPSASILMHYELLDPKSRRYQEMLEFTKAYAAAIHTRYGHCTGHLSFDFKVRYSQSANTGTTLFPIECNPRCHTATVLMRGQETNLTRAYLTALDDKTSASVPLEVYPEQVDSYYWMAHDLVSLLIEPLLHLFPLTRLLYCQATGISHFVGWKDPVFEWWDPMPWLVLNHVCWPLELLFASLTATKWRALNVSTMKMFTDN